MRQHTLGVVGDIIWALFTIYSSLQRRKNCENRLGFDTVTTISWWSTFLAHSVYGCEVGHRCKNVHHKNKKVKCAFYEKLKTQKTLTKNHFGPIEKTFFIHLCVWSLADSRI